MSTVTVYTYPDEHQGTAMTPSIVTLLTGCLTITFLLSSVTSQSFYCQDRSRRECDIIKPHHCYDLDVRSMCCSTCRKWRRAANIGCEYGDRLVVWRTEFGRYTCQSYIAFFSSYNCRRNFEFKRDCCQSCKVALDAEQN